MDVTFLEHQIFFKNFEIHIQGEDLVTCESNKKSWWNINIEPMIPVFAEPNEISAHGVPELIRFKTTEPNAETISEGGMSESEEK
jgi:hypothetical protein